MNNDITEEQIKAANRQFDLQYPNFRFKGAHIPSTWKAHKLTMKKPLTDHQIAQYQEKGYYSDNMQKARAAYQERKRKYFW